MTFNATVNQTGIETLMPLERLLLEENAEASAEEAMREAMPKVERFAVPAQPKLIELRQVALVAAGSEVKDPRAAA